MTKVHVARSGNRGSVPVGKYILSSPAFTCLDLVTIRSPIKLETGALSWGQEGRDAKLTTNLVPRLIMFGVTPLTLIYLHGEVLISRRHNFVHFTVLNHSCFFFKDLYMV